ncbi:hypothetical protein FKM82_003675 [Ascaphus truei]
MLSIIPTFKFSKALHVFFLRRSIKRAIFDIKRVLICRITLYCNMSCQGSRKRGWAFWQRSGVKMFCQRRVKYEERNLTANSWFLGSAVSTQAASITLKRETHGSQGGGVSARPGTNNCRTSF